MEGKYPFPCPAVLGHESAGVVEAVGSMVHYVQPGDHVITCLSAFCGHCSQCTDGHLSLCENKSTELVRQPGEPPRLSPRRRDGQPVPPPVVVRRADAGPRAGAREDRPRHAARQGGAHRLRRHHRPRCGVPHRKGCSRRDRRGHRLRRHRPVGDPGRPHRRGEQDHRGRHGRVEARTGAAARRHPRGQRVAATMRSRPSRS